MDLCNEAITHSCEVQNTSLQENIVFSSNSSSPVLDLYDILNGETLDRNQEESFDDIMQETLNNIRNVSMH